MKCCKCNKEITDQTIFNNHKIDIMSLPDQQGTWHKYCLDCFVSSGLEKRRYKSGGIECPVCGEELIPTTIENHMAGGWFKCLECDSCLEKFNMRKFTKEEYTELRNKLNRQISKLKKASLKTA